MSCISLVPSYKCCRQVSSVDSSLMQKFGHTISQECRGSIIYDKVILWDVHEVFPFLSNHGIVTRYCVWALADGCTEQKLYTKVIKYTIKIP